MHRLRLAMSTPWALSPDSKECLELGIFDFLFGDVDVIVEVLVVVLGVVVLSEEAATRGRS